MQPRKNIILAVTAFVACAVLGFVGTKSVWKQQANQEEADEKTAEVYLSADEDTNLEDTIPEDSVPAEEMLASEETSVGETPVTNAPPIKKEGGSRKDDALLRKDQGLHTSNIKHQTRETIHSTSAFTPQTPTRPSGNENQKNVEEKTETTLKEKEHTEQPPTPPSPPANSMSESEFESLLRARNDILITGSKQVSPQVKITVTNQRAGEDAVNRVTGVFNKIGAYQWKDVKVVGVNRDKSGKIVGATIQVVY